VAVRHGKASSLSGVRRGVESDPEFLAMGPGAVLHGIVDRVVDDYQPVIDGLGYDIEEIEKQVFSEEGEANPVERIYFLKREVLEFSQAAAPLLDPLDRLARARFGQTGPELTEYFRDVHDHLTRVVEELHGYRDMLTGILEANLTQVSVRQNEDMRKISAWVAIAAVPTALASIYGMNFERIPGLRVWWGFPVVLAIMAVSCAVLFRLFRKSGWL
jgi:magnesium transporter